MLKAGGDWNEEGRKGKGDWGIGRLGDWEIGRGGDSEREGEGEIGIRDGGMKIGE
jgi:hypothetical protein